MFRYPYTSMEEFNLDWVIRLVREMNRTIETFVSTNAIKYANPFQWNITSQYEKNTVVMDANSGIAYLSVQPVPSGIAISNTSYWTPVFDLSQLFTGFNKNLTSNDEQLNITSSTNYAIGDWLIWQNKLYEVSAAITAGDLLVPGTNLTQITIESVIDGINTIVGNHTTSINAINTKLDNMGIVNVKDFGATGNGVTDDTQAIKDAVNYGLLNGKFNIYLPHGTYLISGTITLGLNPVHNNIRFHGESIWGTLIVRDPSFDNGDIIDTDNYGSVVEIDNMRIENGGSPRFQVYGGAAIHTKGAANIHDVYICNGYGGILVGGGYNHIDNCYIIHEHQAEALPMTYGIYVPTLVSQLVITRSSAIEQKNDATNPLTYGLMLCSCDGVQVSDSEFKAVTSLNIEGQGADYLDDIYIVNCVFDEARSKAIHIHGTATNFINIRIADCHISNSFSDNAFIDIGDAENVQLIGCNIDLSYTEAVVVRSTAEGVVIANNTFKSNNRSQTANRQSINLTTGVSNVLVANNYFGDTDATFDVAFNGNTNTVVTGNILTKGMYGDAGVTGVVANNYVRQ